MKSFPSLHLAPSSNLLHAASTTLRALDIVNIQSLVTFVGCSNMTNAKSWQHGNVDDESGSYAWSWWIFARCDIFVWAWWIHEYSIWILIINIMNIYVWPEWIFARYDVYKHKCDKYVEYLPPRKTEAAPDRQRWSLSSLLIALP